MNIEQTFYDVLQDFVDFPVSELDTALPIHYAADLNSFMLIQLATALEERFSIRISSQDLQGIPSADDILAYLRVRLGA